MLIACRDQNPAVGYNWSVQKTAQVPATAPAAGSAFVAPAQAPAAVSGASAPDGTAASAGQLIGRVTSVSGGQPTVSREQPGQQVGTMVSAAPAQEPATVLPAGAAHAADGGQTATAGTPLPSAPAPSPGQAEPVAAQSQARDPASSAALSKDPINAPNTPDRYYSAALAATAYVSESGASPVPGPAPAPRQQLTVPGVTSFGQMLGGRKRLRA